MSALLLFYFILTTFRHKLFLLKYFFKANRNIEKTERQFGSEEPEPAATCWIFYTLSTSHGLFYQSPYLWDSCYNVKNLIVHVKAHKVQSSEFW